MSNRRKLRTPRVVPSLSHPTEAVIGSTGVTQRVDRARDPDALDPGDGRHQWVLSTTHTVVDPEPWITPGAENQRLLDAESLLFVAGPFCWKCERRYVRGMGRCSGEPELGR